HDLILSYGCRPSLDTESASALILDFPATRTVEQILAEFKFRAVECHPNKHPENSKAMQTVQKLQKAKEMLTNEESRAHFLQWEADMVWLSMGSALGSTLLKPPFE
uniref:J domain-containing protein n=1 Tax=Piliocolobus tephrosceles TaxID=591936 RepID=A0A8C9IVP8_9PRIM